MREDYNMDIMKELRKNITTISQNAAKTAKKTADFVKLKEQIRQDKKQIKALTYQVGKLYVRLHANNYEKEYEDYFVSMEIVKEELAKKEKELRQMNKKRRCSNCGNKLSDSEDYCSKCGTAADYDTELKEEEMIEFVDTEE